MDLYRLGFHILLIDEFGSSTSCSECYTATKPFRKHTSRQPWRRHLPEQIVHGLLECKSRECMDECGGNSRKWNRDLMAVLNFRRIWYGQYGQGRPRDLSRESGAHIDDVQR